MLDVIIQYRKARFENFGKGCNRQAENACSEKKESVEYISGDFKAESAWVTRQPITGDEDSCERTFVPAIAFTVGNEQTFALDITTQEFENAVSKAKDEGETFAELDKYQKINRSVVREDLRKTLNLKVDECRGAVYYKDHDLA